MIEKLIKPVKFDKHQPFLVVARDGEKFYVAHEQVLAEDSNIEFEDMGARTLLQWAIEVSYPLRTFVRLQKLLSQKYFAS